LKNIFGTGREWAARSGKGREMREIKFRAWDTHRHEFLSGGEVFIAIQSGKHPQNVIYLDIIKDPNKYKDRFLLQQYTGLKDKNGKEIYEGDILHFAVFDYNGADTQHKGVIKWQGTRFAIWHDNEQEYYGSDGAFDLDWVSSQDDELEIIGNIYENSKLLEASNEN
jgi:uncharacterized phage protein (TIGR01671 family)